MLKGVASPRALDKNLYDAQRARRVLDRIVGYDVSALVWSKLAFGLSAGRVQSVALRLIVDSEREIEAFVPEEYWNIGAQLAKLAKANGGAEASRSRRASRRRTARSSRSRTARTAARVKADLEAATLPRRQGHDVASASESRYAPYTTSKLQQDAVNRLGFGAKRTMQVAQGLYEGVDLGKELGTVGLITYMRTDSTRVSPEALQGARDYIDGEVRQGLRPRRSRTSSSRRRTRRTRTRRSGRRRSTTRPRRCASTSRTSSSSSTS